MKKYNKILFIIILVIVVIHINSIKAFGKPISNVFQATIDVVANGTAGEEGHNYDDDINKAIQNAKEKSEIKIKSGKYNIDSIIDKDVTLKSLDNEYVDIITKSQIPNNIKIKVGSKVTINQEGVCPIKIEVKENKKILKGNKIKINAKQGENKEISVYKEVINKLGFHNNDLRLEFIGFYDKNDLSVSNVENNDAFLGEESKRGIYYNLGKINDYEHIIVNLKFDKAGQYPMEIYVDDGRKIQ